MKWATGFPIYGTSRVVEMASATGVTGDVKVRELMEEGIPRANKRSKLIFEGDFEQLRPADPSKYLSAFGISTERARCGADNHEVFATTVDKSLHRKGFTIYVPSLVLMRAIFRPSPYVFKAAFSSVNMDRLAFVDHNQNPPEVVVVDEFFEKFIDRKLRSSNLKRAIDWLQLSRSARSMAQSAYENARVGRLGLALPKGRVRLVFDGLLEGKDLYATRATLMWVRVPEEDSLTGSEETYFFHGTADKKAVPVAAAHLVEIPLRPDGETAVSDEEWQGVEKLLRQSNRGRTLHSRRAILDLVLHKLSSKSPWRKLKTGGIASANVTMAFRRWSMDGSMQRVLGHLQRTRTGPVATSLAH